MTTGKERKYMYDKLREATSAHETDLIAEFVRQLQPTPPDASDVFSQRVAVLEGSIKHHAKEMEQAKAKVLHHKQVKDARVRELFTYLKAQNTVLRQRLEAERQQGLLDGETIMRLTEGLVADSKLEGFEEDADQNASGSQENYSASKEYEDDPRFGTDAYAAQADKPDKLPGEEEGYYYLIDLGNGDVLKGVGDETVASQHLRRLRTAYIKLYPEGATSRAQGHEPPFPRFIGYYGPYPHSVGGEDDPTGFRSYGYVATLEGRLDSDEITRVRKPGGDRISGEPTLIPPPPSYLHIDGTRNDLGQSPPSSSWTPRWPDSSP